MRKTDLHSPLVLAAACAVVGVLAALGTFNSISTFPAIFALVCLLIGALRIWHRRDEGKALRNGLLLAAGAALAVGGWLYQGRVIEERQATRRLAVLERLAGRTVPSLEGLEPLNTDRATWNEAASFASRATIVAFWARWCSPCWKEMAELEELYQAHRDRGLSIVAVTRYDQPADAESRQSDFAKAVDFLTRRGHTFPAAITDDDEIFRAYRVPGPPAAALVDDRGTVVDYAIALDDARALMGRAVELLDSADAGA